MKSTKVRQIEDVLAWLIGVTVFVLIVLAVSLIGTEIIYLIYNLLIRKGFPSLPYASFLQVWCVCFVVSFIGSKFRSSGKSD